MAEIAERKQALRSADARALASGVKSRADLQRENSILSGSRLVVHVKAAKPLR